MAFDVQALRAALADPSRLHPRALEVLAELGASTDAIRARLPATASSFLDLCRPKHPDGYWEHDWIGDAGTVMLAARAAGAAGDGTESWPFVVEPGEEVPETWTLFGSDTEVFAGSCHVKGNLKSLGGALVVLGDLTIDGFYRDDIGSILLVGGKVTVGKHVLTKGFWLSGGELTSPFVHLDFNQGFAKLLGGVRTRLLYENDHGGSRVFGRVEADLVICDELVLDEPRHQRPEELAGLLSIPIDDEDWKTLDGVRRALESGQSPFATR